MDRPGHGPIRGAFRGAGFARAPIIRAGTIHGPYLQASSTLPSSTRTPPAELSPARAGGAGLLAPPANRSRVIGLYGVSANGLRAGSAFTVGILGTAIGIHWSLGLSAVALRLGTLAAGI